MAPKRTQTTPAKYSAVSGNFFLYDLYFFTLDHTLQWLLVTKLTHSDDLILPFIFNISLIIVSIELHWTWDTPLIIINSTFLFVGFWRFFYTSLRTSSLPYFLLYYSQDNALHPAYFQSCHYFIPYSIHESHAITLYHTVYMRIMPLLYTIQYTWESCHYFIPYSI